MDDGETDLKETEELMKKNTSAFNLMIKIKDSV